MTIKQRVINWVASQGSVTYRDIQKYIVEEIKGLQWDNSYRGYFSGAMVAERTGPSRLWFRPSGYFLRGPQRLEKLPNGRYYAITGQ